MVKLDKNFLLRTMFFTKGSLELFIFKFKVLRVVFIHLNVSIDIKPIYKIHDVAIINFICLRNLN